MSSSKLAELISLAKEPSSERRRELLREITDMFFAAEVPHGPAEMELFDGLLGKLANDLEEEVRAELATRMSASPTPPSRLISALAADTIAVARPVLANSTALSDEQLIELAKTQGQEHLRAISSRAQVSEAVSDAIVDHADDTTLGTLLSNGDAQLSRRAAEVAVDRAQQNPQLHEAVVNRQSLPIDLLNEMYFVVESRLRKTIMERNAGMDPAALDEALSAGRKTIAARDGVLPPDYPAAEAYIRNMVSRGQITPQTLASFLRRGEQTRFLCSLAELTDIDFFTVRLIMERKELDALAIICKAAGFEQALFLTFTVLILEPGKGMAEAEAYGQLYSELPRETAMRTIRFWKMRRNIGDFAAA
jgi:uncharacterized protein (DUF2336 family)